VVNALLWGAAVAAVSRPVIGLVAAVAVAAALNLRVGPALCRLGGVFALAALPLYAVAQELRYRYWPDINWPANVSSANDIAWLGLALIGCDLVAAAVYSLRNARHERLPIRAGTGSHDGADAG
jgi:hypothetical protein